MLFHAYLLCVYNAPNLLPARFAECSVHPDMFALREIDQMEREIARIWSALGCWCRVSLDLTRRIMISLPVGCRGLASDTWTPHPRSRSTSCFRPFSMHDAILVDYSLPATNMYYAMRRSPSLQA